MSLGNRLRKDELKLIADELGLPVTDSMKVMDLRGLIEESDAFKNKNDVVQGLIEEIVESEKARKEKEANLEVEKLKLSAIQLEIDLEKAKRASLPTPSQTSEITEIDSHPNNLESLIRSVKTLTIPVPQRAESFHMFFQSLEKAFLNKSVPDMFKAEILLNVLGDRVNNLLVYVAQEDLSNYQKVKELVMKEFQPTPQECLNKFRVSEKETNETYVQFASRLTASFDYYCQLRKVDDFRSLCELIVADKMCDTLDRELMTHIAVKQGESFFRPQQLGRECDIYLSSNPRVNCASQNKTGESKRFMGGRGQRGSNNRAEKSHSKVFVSQAKGSECVLCKKANHPLYSCSQFRELSVYDRFGVVKRNKLCFRCLAPHKVRECQSNRKCFCGQPHHSMIHFPREDNGGSGLQANAVPFVPSTSEERVETGALSHNPIVATSYVRNKTRNVLLSTVRALVKNRRGEWVEVRCLLDVGSQSCLCTRSCAESLQLPMSKINTVISCVNNATMVVERCVRTTLSTKDQSFAVDLSMLVVSKITDLIPNSAVTGCDNMPAFIPLADPSFNSPGKIDMLLGAEVFYQLLRPGQFRTEDSQWLLQNTVFGYVVSGVTEQLEGDRVHCGLVLDGDLNETMRKFWEIENVELERPRDGEVSWCEEHFTKTHQRDEDGRYIVSMPLKENPTCLGKSRDIAIKRLDALWSRLSKDQQYSRLYQEFMQEYESLGHMEKIEESSDPKVAYYIPHHGVLRPENTTTKLRVVFNASSSSTTGISLNDILMKGEVIEDVFETITRFRRHKYAFTADIQKMFRQILIDPAQRNLQRIVWKTEANEEPATYRLKTVTYGTTSAPFLAIRTLQQLAKDEVSRYPLASRALLEDTYMDDIVSGAPDLETAQELQSQLCSSLKSCGMSLHKWSSNSEKLLNSSSSSEVENSFSEGTDMSRTLGICWKPREDSFTFRVSIVKKPSYTKREVLSVIARLFDPLGFLGPVITRAKILLQKLWQDKVDWDDVLPEPIASEWTDFISNLKSIEAIKIERYIFTDIRVRVVLQGFSDASESAYGAVVYLQCFYSSGNAKSTILASKSRVSPIRVMSIPRLELSACVLLAELIRKIRSTLTLTVDNIVLHTDSTIALAWLNTPANHLKTFVANRVAKVQELTEDCEWNHVPSGLNPADVISRGLGPRDLPGLELWWKGPPFLSTRKTSGGLPASPTGNESGYFEELKPNEVPNNVCLATNVQPLLSLIMSRNSKYQSINRIMSYVLRFVNNATPNTVKLSGPLCAKELQKSELYIIQMVQREAFSEEIKNLQCQKSVSPKSKLRDLNPFLDKDGTLRVGGRLKNSDLCYDTKHPAVIPGDHPLTKVLITYLHVKNLHVGATALLHIVREKFWPISGRSICRKIVHECIVCFRAKPIVSSQLMGDLPRERVVPDYPFNCTGADFCGPFMIRYPNQRKGTLHKIYVCIFICFSTKSIHLEMVTDLTSEALIATLKRFFARRGKSAKIYSDNGTNFVGANAEIKRLLKLVKDQDDKIASFLSSEGLEWKFIPPRAPSFGGLWEAAVKSFKYHFKRVVGGSNLTYEEFLTVSLQIESILNSRPMYPLSNNADDLNALTPAHFLIGRPMNTIVEPSLIELNENCLKKWQRITRLVQLLWKRWNRSYLSGLQQRNKWQFRKDNVKVGDLVVLMEDNVPTFNWPLGRIIELFRGEDELVRVVRVRTQNGTYKRAITRVCLLPM